MANFNVRQISSPAVLAAERRRITRASVDNIREEWFVGEVLQTINLAMKVRVKIATEFLRTKVVYNISRPVTKRLSSFRDTITERLLIVPARHLRAKEEDMYFKRGGRHSGVDAHMRRWAKKKTIDKLIKRKVGERKYKVIISNRSKPGEFPKADTTLLMKSIFGEVRNVSEETTDGYVGTPVEYGPRLEIKMNRGFLKRTLLEEKNKIIGILASPLEDREILQ